MEQAFNPLSEVEHARRRLMEGKMGHNVSTYIQMFRTLMYEMPKMTQRKPSRSSWVVWNLGSESKLATTWKGIWVRRWLWRKKQMCGKIEEREKKKDKTNKEQGVRHNRDRDKFNRKQKTGLGEEAFWECSPRKRDYDY